jgi:prolyl oligopeptidase
MNHESNHFITHPHPDPGWMQGCREKSFAGTAISYPATMRDTSAGDVYFGEKVADPYRWLESDTSLATKDWVLAENKVTNNYLSKIPFREEIRNRITSLYNYEKYTSPFRVNNYIYFYKNSGLQNQSVLYRQREGSSEIELFLDPNSFSLTGTTSLSDIEFTEDGALAAYQISEGGSDWRKLIVMDAITKTQVGDTLQDVKFSGISWKGKDGFYLQQL